MIAAREIAPALATQVDALRVELERYAEVTERGVTACRAGSIEDLDFALAERDRLAHGIEVLTQVLTPARLPLHLRASATHSLASLSGVTARVERATADLAATIRERRDALEREITKASHEIGAIASYGGTSEGRQLNVVR